MEQLRDALEKMGAGVLLIVSVLLVTTVVVYFFRLRKAGGKESSGAGANAGMPDTTDPSADNEQGGGEG